MTHSPGVFWFITGSQRLYGADTLRQVAQQSQRIAEGLEASTPYPLVHCGVVTTADEARRVLLEAGADDRCLGVVLWMHTFSPAQMWVAGLRANHKPMVHLHTQFHRDIPWRTIDMNFMNLNQSAHGDREFGYLTARLGVPRKVIAGHWSDGAVGRRLAAWMRVAAAWAESQQLKLARFGDNMRDVAVTEGNKLSSAATFGWSVRGYGVGDLAEAVDAASPSEVAEQLERYEARYVVDARLRADAVRWRQVEGQARIECGLRRFLEEGGFGAFTTTFEDLHGLDQLPGLAVQDLMRDGYGFGAEGDWKTAALLRLVKVMADGRATSFMEDYTYHLAPGHEQVLGAHMLEVCPSIAAERPRIEVHPLPIGGKSDPARAVFDGQPGPAVVASLVDLGPRFRLVVNAVEAVAPPEPLERLPVGRVLWKPAPSWTTAVEAWIHAGGAHHTVLSYAVSLAQLQDFAVLAGIECVAIDHDTRLPALVKELDWGDAVWSRRP